VYAEAGHDLERLHTVNARNLKRNTLRIFHRADASGNKHIGAADALGYREHAFDFGDVCAHALYGLSRRVDEQKHDVSVTV